MTTGHQGSKAITWPPWWGLDSWAQGGSRPLQDSAGVTSTRLRALRRAIPGVEETCSKGLGGPRGSQGAPQGEGRNPRDGAQKQFWGSPHDPRASTPSGLEVGQLSLSLASL